MFDAVATIVMKMRKQRGICNSESLMEWRLKKAAELGYMMAMGQFIKTNKNTWR